MGLLLRAPTMPGETFSYRFPVPITIPAAEPARPQILIADPDEMTFGYLCAALRGAGYLADAVSSGYALLDRMGRGGIHLVAVSLTLSDMSGAVAAARVREICPARPIILLAHRGAGVRHGPLRHAVAACLFKPVDPPQFVGMCQRILGFSLRGGPRP